MLIRQMAESENVTMGQLRLDRSFMGASIPFGTSAFYSRQLRLCPFPAYSVFSQLQFPINKMV